jgi:hypothetical protein
MNSTTNSKVTKFIDPTTIWINNFLHVWEHTLQDDLDFFTNTVKVNIKTVCETCRANKGFLGFNVQNTNTQIIITCEILEDAPDAIIKELDYWTRQNSKLMLEMHEAVKSIL